MEIGHVIQQLEQLAPPALQESYDNAQLLCGDPAWQARGAVICLDATEGVVDEAIEKGCNLIVAHHPIIFSGLKSITGKNYIERTLIKAIKNDIAIYAIHTNLDNVANGVNRIIAEKLGLEKLRMLAPRKGLLRKLYTFVPHDDAEVVRQALFSAGAGKIGLYDQCSYNTDGTGTFRAGEEANPQVGEKGELHWEPETRIEIIFPAYLENGIINALLDAHPYEEVAFDIVSLENAYQEIGSGMAGELPQPIEEMTFLNQVKQIMRTRCIRHTALLGQPISRVAICGGSGSFLLPEAIRAGADIFITSDFKYHQFFDADGKILIADIGHYESEQYTKDLLYAYLRDKFPNFALHLTDVNTNPINYL